MTSRLFSVALFPAVTLGALVMGISLATEGISLGWACVATTSAVTALLVALEWWRPREQEMRFNADSQAAHDISHFLVASRFGGPLGSYVLAVGAAHLVGTRWGDVWLTWPTGWPLAVQAMVAWLVLGLLDYWTHRAYHSINALWWLHAVHHDTDGVNVLKSGRVHLFEGMVNGAVIVLMAFAGAPLVAITVAAAANTVVNNLSHANLDQRLWRPLHWVVPTVHLHRIHHAKDRELHDTNLGLPIFDLAFGTYTSPSACPSPGMGRVDPRDPTSFVGQLVLPIRKWSTAARTRLGVQPTSD